MSGFDWFYFIGMRSHLLGNIFFPAIPIGGIVPILAPLIIILVGFFFKKKNTSSVGWALAQAAIFGSFVSSLYKAFTGRIQPDLHNLTVDISQGFNFGFFEHGIFWGWPSSHTAIAFAMALTLIHLFPHNKKLHMLALIYAFYIGIGISFTIHWFSEFIAGAMIGAIIGTVVGESFRNFKSFPSEVNSKTSESTELLESSQRV